MSSIQPQRRARSIAMTDSERDAFLAEARTCRVASVSPGGRPHVTPLWYAWDGSNIWLHSIVRAQRWADMARDHRVAVVVDAGELYHELRGVEFAGVVEIVGEVPRVGRDSAELEAPERLFAQRYHAGVPLIHDGRHAWLRFRPERQYTWDFRKLPGGPRTAPTG